MRILFVVHGFPPFQVGGTETLARNFARYLAKNGHHDVTIFAPALHRQQEGDTFVDGVKVHRVFFAHDRETRFPDTYQDDAVDLQFAKFVSELKPDVALVMHTIFLSAGILDVLSKMSIPNILYLSDFHYTCHMTHLLTADMKPCDGPGDGTRCANCILATAPYLVERETTEAAELGRRRVSLMMELLQKPNLVWAPSHFVKEKYVEFGLKKGRILVIPPGVDVKAIKRQHKPVYSDKLRFGYLGGNVEAKGVSIVLEAFNHLADDTVELVIAGLGTECSSSSLIVPRQARLLGVYSPDDPGEVLSMMDVLVVPSRCHESYNLLIREAFAAKIPVIVSDLRAQSDAVRDGIDGFHFRAGDTGDLTTKMRVLKDRRINLEKLKDGIPNVPDVERQVAKIESVLWKLASRRKMILGRRQMAASASQQTHDAWYVESLAQKVITVLRDELSARAEEVSQLNNGVSRLKNEVTRLNSEATRLKNELDEIKRSVGYWLVRFYGRRLDQLFPDDTRRGNLREKITRTLQLLLKTA